MAHGDYTGELKSQLAQKFAAEQALRAKELSLVSSVVAEGSKETVDLMPLETPSSTGEEGEIVEVGVADPQFDPVTFRARETIEGVTVGVDNNYNFEEGRSYKVPRWVVDHLDRQGLVFH